MRECGVWDAGMSTCLRGSRTLCRQGMRPQTTRELPAGRPSHSCPSEAPGQPSEIVQSEFGQSHCVFLGFQGYKSPGTSSKFWGREFHSLSRGDDAFMSGH